MRCMITASRRASATMAFFIPRCLAICIAQALSQDHFFDRSMHDGLQLGGANRDQGIRIVNCHGRPPEFQ